MSIDVHSLMSIVDMSKLLKKSDSKNVQINDLVRAMVLSEPCLFNNSLDNLMPVNEKDFVVPFRLYEKDDGKPKKKEKKSKKKGNK